MPDTRKPAFPDALAGRIRALSRPMEPYPTDLEPRLPPMPGVRAILFDVYGTLFISAAGDIDAGRSTDQATALHEALRSTGLNGRLEEASRAGARLLPRFIREEHERRRAGGTEYPEIDIRETWRQVTDELAGRSLLDGEVTDEQLRELAVEYECRVNPVWPMPLLRETVRALSHHGMLLGIVSNAQFFTPLLFPAFFGEDACELGFEPALCAWSWELREAKPSTALHRRALEHLQDRLHVSPDQVLYVGNDRLNDLWPARQAGCRTALFAGDDRALRLRDDDPRCADVRPIAVVTHLAQLLDIVPASGPFRQTNPG